MVIQAVVDIDVDTEFGLAKALRICQGCGIRRIASDSVKRFISIVVIGDIENKIKCLSSIKGFFTIDIRLIVELCNLDSSTLKAIGVVSTPRGVSSRVLGYTYVNGKLCVFMKTSRKNTVIVRVLKSKSLPVFIEPSLYLIQASSEEILSKALDILKVLEVLEDRLTISTARVCRERVSQ